MQQNFIIGDVDQTRSGGIRALTQIFGTGAGAVANGFGKKPRFCRILGNFYFTEMAKDAGLLEISGKFQICPVNPSSLSDNLSDNFKNENNFELFADLPV